MSMTWISSMGIMRAENRARMWKILRQWKMSPRCWKTSTTSSPLLLQPMSTEHPRTLRPHRRWKTPRSRSLTLRQSAHHPELFSRTCMHLQRLLQRCPHLHLEQTLTLPQFRLSRPLLQTVTRLSLLPTYLHLRAIRMHLQQQQLRSRHFLTRMLLHLPPSKQLPVHTPLLPRLRQTPTLPLPQARLPVHTPLLLLPPI